MIAHRLHHASLHVRDIERARRFYGDVLGLEEIERPNFPFPGAWYRAGDAQLHLIVTPPGLDVGTRPADVNPMAPHTAFAIEDYDAVRAYFQSRGIEVLEAGAAIGQMWVRDPDGNIVELIAPPRG